MANRGSIPGREGSEPIESRRAPVTDADQVTTLSESDGAESPIDLPDLGELSPEAARPSPLDDIAEAEREQAPRD